MAYAAANEQENNIRIVYRVSLMDIWKSSFSDEYSGTASENLLISQFLRFRKISGRRGCSRSAFVCADPVPYTHLTLPTNREVEILVVAVSFKKKTVGTQLPHKLSHDD